MKLKSVLVVYVLFVINFKNFRIKLREKIDH